MGVHTWRTRWSRRWTSAAERWWRSRCSRPTGAIRRASGRRCEAGEQIATVAGEETSEGVNPEGPKEVVLDKGYHSNEVLTKLAEWEVRSYCSEPERGRRRWEGKQEEQAAVYANRRRIQGERGKRLLRQRGEKL